MGKAMPVKDDGKRDRARTLQAGAVPFRRVNRGTSRRAIEVLLITNTAGGWIVPKGRIDAGRSPQETALIEAYEEAGVVASAIGEELGHYSYLKMGRRMRVRLYALEVERVMRDWKERDARRREWLSLPEACARAAFPGLRRILAELEDAVG
ncbi:MAG: NUDIX hydrolase [Phycisphaerae bacterium]|nr:NUDIX hydrolase [Phycisphaerae bacterium]